MMLNYPFFSFPQFRGYTSYGPITHSSFMSTSSNLEHGSSMAPIPRQSPNFPYGRSTVRNGQTSSMQHFEGKKNSPKAKSLREASKTKDFSRKNSSCNDFDDKEKPLFDIFGLQLFSDDVLLICLIFFLYQEGVQDQYLFMALVLLLLS